MAKRKRGDDVPISERVIDALERTNVIDLAEHQRIDLQQTRLIGHLLQLLVDSEVISESDADKLIQKVTSIH